MNFEFSMGIWFKLVIILLLFVCSIILLLLEKRNNTDDINYLESGIGNNTKNYLNRIAGFSVGISSIYGTYVGIESLKLAKSQFKNDEEILKIQKEVDTLIEEKNNIKAELNLLEVEKKDIEFYINTQFNILLSIKEFTDKMFIYQTAYKENLIKPNININGIIETRALLECKVQEMLSASKTFVRSNPSYLSSDVSTKINEAKIIRSEGDNININNIIEDEDIKKSFFLYGFLNKFEVLDVFSKLAISLLIFNSLIFSCVISIIFVFFGDYLLERFKIEVKYPKLAEIIKLRRKFQKYYLIFNILMILSVVIIEVIFSIAVLLL